MVCYALYPGYSFVTLNLRLVSNISSYPILFPDGFCIYFVYTFKPKYIIPLPIGMVSHALYRTGLMSGPSTPHAPAT